MISYFKYIIISHLKHHKKHLKIIIINYNTIPKIVFNYIFINLNNNLYEIILDLNK